MNGYLIPCLDYHGNKNQTRMFCVCITPKLLSFSHSLLIYGVMSISGEVYSMLCKLVQFQ